MATTFMKKTTLIAAVILLTASVFKSQDDNTAHKHYPSVLLGVGGLKFTGDVGKLTDVNPLLDARLGYYLKAEYRFGKYFGMMFGGLYGKFAGTDNSKASHLNFQSKAIQADLNFVTYFDHLFKQNDEVSPFLSAGIGYVMFDAKGDLKNGDNTYYYWSDGSVRDQPDVLVNQATATIIKRDYTYETQLKDSATNYSRAALVIPIQAGFDFQLGKLHRWDVQIGFNYNIILSDYVDNKKAGGNDSYWMGHVGFKYTFAPKPKTPQDDVDFSHIDKMDVDGDGVADNEDRCLSTPKGVPVDNHGCPMDGDKDGVADHMDKEPSTKKGAKVDGFGVTINEDSLAYHQIMWDSLAAERNENFNENPSIETLKKVEKDPIKSGVKIPDEIVSADINKDGFISAEEISKTIDGFFEGANDFTVDKINRLIDFFFEQ
ncbi:MAG: hypothetical protein IAF38_09030 [Bacteroidia bacterium]|nr:hypothetical protein [Bacteroidia bacterium]